MVIVVRNGHGDMSSNPGQDWLNNNNWIIVIKKSTNKLNVLIQTNLNSKYQYHSTVV